MKEIMSYFAILTPAKASEKSGWLIGYTTAFDSRLFTEFKIDNWDDANQPGRQTQAVNVYWANGAGEQVVPSQWRNPMRVLIVVSE
jgi:hypothetical protein